MYAHAERGAAPRSRQIDPPTRVPAAKRRTGRVSIRVAGTVGAGRELQAIPAIWAAAGNSLEPLERRRLLSAAVQFTSNAETVNASAGTFSIPVTLTGTPALGATPFGGGYDVLKTPDGSAIDSSGNLYVADNATNGPVVKIAPNGTFTTVANNFGGGIPSGLSLDSSGNLYVACDGTNSVYKVTPAGAVGTFATGFGTPDGLAVDAAGNLYVAHYQANTVSKVTPAGGVSTFASGFNKPEGLAFGPSVNLYVGQNSGNISKVTPAGVVSPFASGFSPAGLACNAAGNVYASDPDPTGNSIIRKITPDGTVTPFATGFVQAQGLAFRAGNLYAADLQAGTVDKVTPAGAVSTCATVGATEPISLAFESAGDLFVGSLAYPTVSEVAPDGTVGTCYSENGASALGLAIDSAGTVYFSKGANSVSRLSTAVSVPFTLSRTAASGAD